MSNFTWADDLLNGLKADGWMANVYTSRGPTQLGKGEFRINLSGNRFVVTKYNSDCESTISLDQSADAVLRQVASFIRLWA